MARISRRIRTFGLALGMVMAATACQRTPKTQQAPPAALATAPVPLTIASSNADAQVSLTLPEAIKLYPDLHARLYTEAQTTLTAFMDQAHKDRAENSADGIEEPPYYHTIGWKITAQTPRFLSLLSEADDYQGGAHPNHILRTLLWDKIAKAEIAPKRLFKAGADFKTINAYLCHQVEAERSKRAGEPISQSGSGFACPKFITSRLVLIPVAAGGKVGAIDALYAPYDVGPYAEGPYEIRVPQAMLGDVLAPEFADQFGGEPVKERALSDPDAQ